MVTKRKLDDKPSTFTAVLIAFIAVLPMTIASVATLFTAMNTSKKVEEVHKATNSMKDALVAAALVAGHAQGVLDEKAAKKAKDAETAAARVEGANEEKSRVR